MEIIIVLVTLNIDPKQPLFFISLHFLLSEMCCRFSSTPLGFLKTP